MRNKKQSERGFSLVLSAVCVTVMLGMLGLSLDVGRIFIAKNELQAFTDAAALAAVTQLDGTRTGVVSAENLAQNGPLPTVPNSINFDTQTVTGVTTGYRTSFNGNTDTFATASANPANYRFVSVTAAQNVNLNFLPILPSVPRAYSVSSSAIGGQMAKAGSPPNIVPFSPDARTPTDPTGHFGLTVGVQYALKWANGNVPGCAGDIGFNPGNAPSAHGFVDLGQGNGNSALRGVIEYSTCPLCPISVPSTLSGVPGNRGASIFSATANRSAQDPDQTSVTWDEYKAAGIGNGRRVVMAPINDPTLAAGNGSNRTVEIIGFGAFLLDPANTISGNAGALCATYIGTSNDYKGGSAGSNGAVTYSAVLFR
jgi:Flp pilus assembly protein TadG